MFANARRVSAVSVTLPPPPPRPNAPPPTPTPPRSAPVREPTRNARNGAPAHVCVRTKCVSIFHFFRVSNGESRGWMEQTSKRQRGGGGRSERGSSSRGRRFWRRVACASASTAAGGRRRVGLCIQGQGSRTRVWGTATGLGARMVQCGSRRATSLLPTALKLLHNPSTLVPRATDNGSSRALTFFALGQPNKGREVFLQPDGPALNELRIEAVEPRAPCRK